MVCVALCVALRTEFPIESMLPTEEMVLPDRIELSTSPLPMECSTTELRQHARYPGNRPSRAPQAGGSCHKDPSGASTRAGGEGPKWAKIDARDADLAESGESGSRPARTAESYPRVGHPKHTMFGPMARRSFGGHAMTDRQGKGAEKTGADVKDSRRGRLKLALRENLRRRKLQARGRSDTSASSESADASLDDASGEKPDE